MESLMGDEQRRLFRETQAVMSLLEGFSDYIMDEVGRGLVEDVERIPARFHDRRQRPTGVRARRAPPDRHGPQDGAVRQGRALRARIAEARGRPALARIWDGPDSLPSAEEIAEPGALDRADPRLVPSRQDSA